MFGKRVYKPIRVLGLKCHVTYRLSLKCRLVLVSWNARLAQLARTVQSRMLKEAMEQIYIIYQTYTLRRLGTRLLMCGMPGFDYHGMRPRLEQERLTVITWLSGRITPFMHTCWLSTTKKFGVRYQTLFPHLGSGHNTMCAYTRLRIGGHIQVLVHIVVGTRSRW